jgi:hypothetical protein
VGGTGGAAGRTYMYKAQVAQLANNNGID